jgi:hypothetical protein
LVRDGTEQLGQKPETFESLTDGNSPEVFGLERLCAPDRFRQTKFAALGIRATGAGGGAGSANRLKRLENLGLALYLNWGRFLGTVLRDGS